MTACNYSDRLELCAGELVRIIQATPKSTKKNYEPLDVYREWESGETQCRNLYSSMMGYRVGFPGEFNSLYKCGSCGYEESLQDFGECKRMTFFPSRNLKDEEKELIVSKYPDFKYVLKKWTASIDKTLQALRIWFFHSDIEFVLAAGWEKIALNKAFWRMTKEKRKEVVKFMRETGVGALKWPLADILQFMKVSADIVEFSEYLRWRMSNGNCGYEVWKYLNKIKMAGIDGRILYRDYKSLLLQTEHDSNDSYWKWPKDLQKKHDELLAEVERVKALKNLEKLREKQEKYTKAVKKLLRNDYKIDGYRVYIPSTVDEIQEQASALHQCLIQCDYVSKVINRSCVLVFVSKNGKPVATAELLKGNKIGQFYADELDRNNCLPSKKVREVMNKWVERKGKIRWSA